MNKQTERLISADKLLRWLKIREEEAYANAAQTFSPSLFKGKADAFNDVAEYLNSGHFDPIPLPTLKPGDAVMYKCPCGSMSSQEDWDKTTHEYYNGDAATIQDTVTMSLAAHFICPKCGDQVDFGEMEGQEHVR